MRRRRLILMLVAVLGAALAVHVSAYYASRERPNYDCVEDGLYLGGYVLEPPPGTTAVLNLCESEDRYRAESHRWEPIRDAAPAPSLEWLADHVAFIERERAAGRAVYVHCRNGVSRSGMVMVAYVMKRHGLTREAAINRVRSSRPSLRPNPAFLLLLDEWQRRI